MKIIVIGCNHAGTWAAKTLKATDPTCQVVAYDRNDNISFLACGIALWVGGTVKDPEGLFYASPEGLESEGISVRMGYDVTEIDWSAKKNQRENPCDGSCVRGQLRQIDSGCRLVAHYAAN